MTGFVMKGLAAGAGLALALSMGAASAAPDHSDLKIGFMAAMSGTQSALGRDMLDGFNLYLKEHDGKLGGRKINLVVADAQVKPVVGVQLAKRLIDRDKVPIIVGVAFSNVMLAVHDPIVSKKVILIGSNAGPSQIAGKDCSPYFFSTSWQNDTEAEPVGAYAEEKGYKRIVTMVPNYQSGFDFITGFKRYYHEPLLDEIYTPLDQQDFSTELAKIAASKPDAVFAFYPGGLGVNFLRQYKQAGLLGKIPLLSASTTDAINLPAQRESALGVITGTAWGIDVDTPSNKAFVEAFIKDTGRLPSHYAAQNYDAAQLLDSALNKVDGDISDQKAFLAAIKQADFPSVRGDFKFNNNNFPIQDLRVFEVARDAEGRISMKTISVPLPNHQDAYHGECPLS